jgi:hypothetical protein
MYVIKVSVYFQSFNEVKSLSHPQNGKEHKHQLQVWQTKLFIFIKHFLRDPEEDDRLLILILVASFIIISMIVIIGGTACILLCFEESIEEKESEILAQLSKVRNRTS